MHWLRRLVVLGIFVAALVLGWRFAKANGNPIFVDYLVGTVEAPLWAVIGGCIGIGVALGLVVMGFQAARLAGMDGGWEFAAAVAVVAGHVWPVQLGFRGGRGLGPLLGAWLVLAPLAIGICLAVAGIAWAMTKRRIAAGLFGAFLLPVTTWWETHDVPAAVFAAVSATAFVATSAVAQEKKEEQKMEKKADKKKSAKKEKKAKTEEKK